MTDQLERRLARVEAMAEVRQTLALFSDAIGRDDRPAFGALWDDAGVWEIGEPYPRRAEGREAIAAMLHELMVGWEFFVQLTHSSVITLDLDTGRAWARSEIREFARQADRSRSYDNFAIYDDALVRRDGRWHFARRSYHYIWIDDSPITGQGYRLPGHLGRMPHGVPIAG